jgi:hypothetical protein
MKAPAIAARLGLLIAGAILFASRNATGSPSVSPGGAAVGEPIELLDVPGIRGMSPQFLRKFALSLRAIGVDPDGMSGTISLESRWQPWAINVRERKDQPIDPSTGKHGKAIVAAGLFQLYWTQAPRFGITVDQFAKLSADDQLPYLLRMWDLLKGVYPGQTWTPEAIYMANFLPKYVNSPDGQILGAKDSAVPFERAVYEANENLDRTHKGTITVGDMRGKIRGLLNRAATKPRVIV